MIRRSRATAAAVAAVVLIAGCQSGFTLRPPPDDGLGDLTHYGTRIRQMSASELDEQYRLLNQELPNESTPEDSIKLALLLSNPQSPYYDRDRAMAILDAIAGDERARDSQAEFASLMHDFLAEQPTQPPLASIPPATVPPLRDDSGEAKLRETLRNTRQALEQERKQREQLQKQLNALRQLEERISEREAEETPPPNTGDTAGAQSPAPAPDESTQSTTKGQ